MRIGTVPYHNALPLTWGLDVKKLIPLSPRQLLPALLDGQLDVALMPSYGIITENLHMYPEAGVIACDGAVASVGFFLRDEITTLGEIDTIFWDDESLTSVNMAKILLHRGYDRNLKSVKTLPAAQSHEADALFLIGDKALFFKEKGYRYIDLGSLWKDFTGFGFLFAAWASTRPLQKSEISLLMKARKKGLAAREEIIAKAHPARHAILNKYYFNNILFEETPSIRQGFDLYKTWIEDEGASRIAVKKVISDSAGIDYF